MPVSVDELRQMYDEVQNGPAVFQPSTMWHTLARKHVTQLEQEGLANFKRTINQNYFHIMPLYPNKQFMEMLSKSSLNLKIFTNPLVHVGTVEYDDFRFSLGGLIGIFYVLYVRMFYEYTKRRDTKQFLTKLEEPDLGNPLKVKYDNKEIAFDICNSLLEYYAISEGVDLSKKMTIAELGAGYGRLAYVFLRLNKGSKYVIFDIPPTLYVAQSYLSCLFPELRIFKFRHFDNFEEIRKEYEESDLCFFTSNQLALFPSKIFDLFINISSLHEMRKDQISAYIKLIDKTTGSYFFTKQYPGTMHLTEDMAGAYELSFDEYPFPKKWETLYKRRNQINPLFVEALYRMDAAEQGPA